MIGVSSIGAEARLHQNSVERLKPSTQRAFVSQFIFWFRILLPVFTGAAPCLGATPVNPL
jgi:hypothetical protein